MPTKPQRPHRGGRAAGATDRLAPGWRGRRHLLPAAFVLAYLLAGGLTMAGSGRVAGAGWLALHLVLLGAVTNAIVVWSEHFAAALLHTRPVGDRWWRSERAHLCCSPWPRWLGGRSWPTQA
jgi:nitrite reductase (NO-forming)